MATLVGIKSKIHFLARLNPKIWDVIPKQPFPFSNAHIDLMVADVVKNAATLVEDKKLAKELAALSKEMARGAGNAVVASWEPGDDICPPWPFPWPGPWWRQVEGPHPDPWKAVTGAEQIELAHALTQLAGLTTSKEFNTQLKAVATGMARGVASSLADEFERCGTVPRRPFPRPR
jgi:hypothetical protein